MAKTRYQLTIGPVDIEGLQAIEGLAEVLTIEIVKEPKKPKKKRIVNRVDIKARIRCAPTSPGTPGPALTKVEAIVFGSWPKGWTHRQKARPLAEAALTAKNYSPTSFSSTVSSLISKGALEVEKT